MFFQDSIPNTSVYMIAGYAVFFIVSILYLASLSIRWRNLKRDLETLEELDKEQ